MTESRTQRDKLKQRGKQKTASDAGRKKNRQGKSAD
jgi:hypothetical protein